MLIILETLLIISLLVAYWLSDRELTAPAVLFCASFVFSCAWAVMYAERWDLGPHANTFFVLLLGAVEFVAVSQLVHAVVKKFGYKGERVSVIPKGELPRKVLLVLLVLVEVFTILFTIRTIMRITGKTDLSAAILEFRNANATGNSMAAQLGFLYYLAILVRAAGFWTAFQIGRSFGRRRWPGIWLLLSYGASLLFSLLSGGRHDLINMILALFGAWLLTGYRVKRKEYRPIRIKRVLLILPLIAAGLALFTRLSSLIGRTVERSYYTYYLAIYCGAHIKNLDLFLEAPTIGTTPWGRYTFINVIRWLGGRFGLAGANYSIMQEYNSVNGEALGNVYTTYHAFIADFGYIGVFLLIALMAVICQIVYERARDPRRKNSLSAVVYCFMVGTILFSFFSNKFYEAVFNIDFVKYLLCWIMLDFVLLRRPDISYSFQEECEL